MHMLLLGGALLRAAPPRGGNPLALGARAAVSPLQIDNLHRFEVERGWSQFGRVLESVTPRRSFDDGDFETREVERGFAGPDEAMLRDGHCLHASRSPVISAAECAAVIAEARAAMASGKKSTFTYTAASRIDEVHVSELPQTRKWLSERLADTFWPLLESRFGERDELEGGRAVSSSQLAVYDSLVIKYDALR